MKKILRSALVLIGFVPIIILGAAGAILAAFAAALFFVCVLIFLLVDSI